LNDKIAINTKSTIAVASGKGGVGKSTVTVNLALSLAKSGQKIGLLDADIYGPNIPLMLGLDGVVANIEDGKLLPIKKYNLQIMSVGFISPAEKALVWRGPLANKLIEQFLSDVQWGELDTLIIDLPPGTGDVPLSIIQKAPLTGGIIITTPQEAAIADVKKMINMYQITNTPILGIVENMKYLICPDSGKKVDLFPRNDKRTVSEILGYPLLIEIPFEPQIGLRGKDGSPFYLNNEKSHVVDIYKKLAAKINKNISNLNT